MTRRSLYLDSSALIKLVFEEHETGALEAFLRDRPVRVSSSLARVEVMRAARTAGDERPGHAARFHHDVHLAGYGQTGLP